eukprot:EG_transcript_4579
MPGSGVVSPQPTSPVSPLSPALSPVMSPVLSPVLSPMLSPVPGYLLVIPNPPHTAAPMPVGGRTRPSPVHVTGSRSMTPISRSPQPLSPSSPNLGRDLFVSRGVLRDPTPTSCDSPSSFRKALHKNLRNVSAGLGQTKGRFSSPVSPLRLPCKACGITLPSEADWELHLASKEHKKRHHDREQRSVLVTGLPGTVPTQIIAFIFNGFELGDDAIEYVANPWLHDDRRDQGQRPTEPHWHVLLRDVDEARRASKLSPVTVLDYTVIVAMAIQPHHCAVCNVTVNSAQQLQQHWVGTRHQEVLKQRQALMALTVTAVPAHATEADVLRLFDGFDVIEGGIAFEVEEGDPTSRIALVTFTSQEACDAAAVVADMAPTILGQEVEVTRKQDAAAVPKLEIPKSGLKTAKEVHMLVSSLLYTHHITDLTDIPSHLFSRVHSTFMSCKPYLFAPFHPRDRFFAEFEAHAGSRRGFISLEDTRAILQQMDGDWGFQLPLGVVQWMEAKVAKYCRDSEGDLLPKSTFVQIRNLKWTVFQVVEQIIEKLAANRVTPPPVLHPMQPVPRATSPGQSGSCESSSSNASFEVPEDETFNVDDQPWDDCTLDVAWVLE